MLWGHQYILVLRASKGINPSLECTNVKYNVRMLSLSKKFFACLIKPFKGFVYLLVCIDVHHSVI